MMTIISDTNVEMSESIFINFLQHFLKILLISACIQLFNINRSGAGVENLPLDDPMRKKSCEIRLGIRGRHRNTAHHTITITKFLF